MAATRRPVTAAEGRAVTAPIASGGDLWSQPAQVVRVAVYVRISTDEAHQPYSLDAQETRLRAYLSSQPGWELAKVFTDQASGATMDRDGLQRLLREARAGRFDIVLVYRVDRCSRSVRGLAAIVDELDKAGVAFRSATEPFDTATAAGRMMMQMLAVFAEFERATIIDRVVAGMERKAARGEWTSGSRPYGYTIDKPSGHLTVCAAEAPLVAVIFDRYTKHREGARSIANLLNTQGHRTKTARPWSHTAILTVLRNRAYLGEVFFRGAYHPAPHPPLVTAEVFTAAQELLDARGQDHAQRASNSSDHLLAGLIVCALCGKRFVGNAATGNRYRYRYYTCFTHQRYGKTACPSQRLPAEQLDNAILDALLHVYDDDALLDEAVAQAFTRADTSRDQHRAELATVDAEIAKNNVAVDRYLTAFENGSIDEAAVAHRIRDLRDRTTDLTRRRVSIADALDQQPKPPTPADLARLRARVATLTRTGPVRKALLRALVHEITVTSRDDIQPVFRIPTRTEQPDETKVRELSGSVPAAGFEPVAFCSGGRTG